MTPEALTPAALPQPAAAWRSLYRFESHYLDLGGHRMHYVDEGQGLPLLMVHGNPTWSFYWRELIRAMKDRYRAVAVDHIGCGLSDKPPANAYRYDLSQRIADLVQLIRALDLQQITLVVHDWGGAIGLGAALEDSERIARIVLLNTGAFPPPFVPLRIRACRMPVVGTLAIRGFNAFARAALWMATERPQRLQGAVAAGLLAPYRTWNDRVAIDRFVRDIPFSTRHPTWSVLERIESGLPSLADRPVQMIWGMRDWCFRPSCLERLRVRFPDADVRQIVDAGHYVMEDAREQVIAAINEFLVSTDARVARYV